MKRYILRDRTRSGLPVIGAAEMHEGFGPSEILNLAQTGQLHIQAQMSDERRRQIEESQKQSEAELEEQSRAAEAESSALPEGEYDLESLKLKQLYALCEQRGLKAYGTKEASIARLRSAKSAPDDSVDLDAASLADLKRVAKGYGVSAKGSREAIIQRILDVADDE